MSSQIQRVQIRQPATANLMIDSGDRYTIAPDGALTTTQPSDNFTIQRPQSILNGFFHRIGTTEVVVSWSVPNISTAIGNTTFSVVMGLGTSFTVTLPSGLYTVEECLDTLVVLLNITATLGTWSITNTLGNVELVCTTSYTITESTLSNQLSMAPGVAGTSRLVAQPDLRPVSAIDFVSQQLTYNQQLKDATSSSVDRNVLCRFYFAWDTPPTYDTYGFPILMGYTQFTVRRTFSPPKQIRWETNMPIGQMAFQVYYSPTSTTDNYAAPSSKRLSSLVGTVAVNSFAWQMTLQVSED